MKTLTMRDVFFMYRAGGFYGNIVASHTCATEYEAALKYRSAAIQQQDIKNGFVCN